MRAESGSPLAGIFTPNLASLDPKGRIQESELYRYVKWLIDSGVDGLFPNGSTGEFTRFTASERRQITQIVCEAAGGRVPVIAGTAEANIYETLVTCEVYLEFGARAVAIVSPYYYRLSQASIYAYFREIAINSPIDVMLYNIPMFASPIDLPTVRRLAELPRIIGIKDSSGDIGNMLRMMGAVHSSRPDFVFFTGWDPAMVPMIAMGCQGGTFALSGVVPEPYKRVFQLTQAGRLKEALAIQVKLAELFDRLVYTMDFPEGIRVGVESRGFDFRLGRLPRSGENPLKSDDISNTIAELLMMCEATLH